MRLDVETHVTVPSNPKNPTVNSTLLSIANVVSREANSQIVEKLSVLVSSQRFLEFWGIEYGNTNTADIPRTKSRVVHEVVRQLMKKVLIILGQPPFFINISLPGHE